MTKEELFVRIATADAKTIARISAAIDDRTQAEPQSLKLFTVTAAARRMGISRATACRMLKDGTLGTIEVRPGCRRVSEIELLRIVKGGE